MAKVFNWVERRYGLHIMDVWYRDTEAWDDFPVSEASWKDWDLSETFSLTAVWLVVCYFAPIFCKICLQLWLVTRATDRLRCERTDGATIHICSQRARPWTFGKTTSVWGRRIRWRVIWAFFGAICRTLLLLIGCQVGIQMDLKLETEDFWAQDWVARPLALPSFHFPLYLWNAHHTDRTVKWDEK